MRRACRIVDTDAARFTAPSHRRETLRRSRKVSAGEGGTPRQTMSLCPGTADGRTAVESFGGTNREEIGDSRMEGTQRNVLPSERGTRATSSSSVTASGYHCRRQEARGRVTGVSSFPVSYSGGISS